jgi:ATP-binding cassette subfamily C protein
LSNVLMLTDSFFMLQVYDRVLLSRSVPTLIGLAVLAGGLHFCATRAVSQSGSDEK